MCLRIVICQQAITQAMHGMDQCRRERFVDECAQCIKMIMQARGIERRITPQAMGKALVADDARRVLQEEFEQAALVAVERFESCAAR